MFIVTTQADGELAGCLVGFASQVSIRPRRFLVGLSDKNHTFAVASRASHLIVHVVRRDDRELAELFGEQTGDTVDKFARCSWQPGPHDVPVLAGPPAWFSGRILLRERLGDHVAFLLEPEQGSAGEDLGDLLTFSDVSDLQAGHDA
ncbi:MAG: flavin reductase [Actinomycetota bacterium]|nr:MAG: flavin reductase [Actinomycetota bacterium]